MQWKLKDKKGGLKDRRNWRGIFMIYFAYSQYNSSAQGGCRKPGKRRVFRACTAKSKGERREGRVFISNIFIQQVCPENRMKDQ